MSKFVPAQLVDAMFSFQAGVNTGVDPQLLPPNQLADATNVTVRGTLAKPRPPYRKFTLDFGDDDAVATALKKGRWQGAAHYKPDSGTEFLVAAVSGRLFKFLISGTSIALSSEIAITGGPNPADRMQAWLWQSEKWIIWTDGLSLPIFFDGNTARRSTYNTPILFSSTTTATFVVPAIGATVVINLVSAAGVLEGDILTVQNKGQFIAQSIAVNAVTAVNISGAPVGSTTATNTNVSWQHISTELPPGRMGVYGRGRNWMSLIDGKQFIASDLVGGSSGTPLYNFRDAVLHITENNYLAGGGNFTVPGSSGEIRAMRFAATLDASLGQGPLQVFTPKIVFSCNAPVDRLTWQDLTNPILTESLIANGALGQNSTQVANSDIWFRSLDGIRSLQLGRIEFNKSGNTPQSREVETLLSRDSVDLLPFGSAALFDNRLLMSALPALNDQGVYFQQLIPLNFDPISSLRGKGEAVYDSTAWSGLNTLQLVVGEFSLLERCFAFSLNTITDEIELYEILPQSTSAIYDNDTVPITWTLESPSLDFGKSDPRKRELLRLLDGEVYVDQLLGSVDFQAWYKPDQWSCWVPWHQWTECQDLNKPDSGPQFRPRMGLGEPMGTICDVTTNRPLREAYIFQLKFVITGHCRFRGCRIKAITSPEPAIMAPRCNTPCPPP